MKGDGGPSGRMGQPGKTVEFYTYCFDLHF